MIKNIFRKQVKAIPQVNRIVFTPVYNKKLLGVMYKEGEILPHARMKVIYEDMRILVGTCFKEEKTFFFVATDTDIINHIQSIGAVPLIQNQDLRFYTNKKEMQYYVRKYNSIISA